MARCEKMSGKNEGHGKNEGQVFNREKMREKMRVRSLIVHSWFIINSTCKENLVFQPPVFPFSKGLRLVML